MTTEERFPINCRVERPPLKRQANRLRTGTVIGYVRRGKRSGWLIVLWDGRSAEQHADPVLVRRVETD